MSPTRVLAAVRLALCLLAGLPAPAAAQWLTFSAAPDARPAGRADAIGADASSPVRGYLSVPVEPGRHPAVLLLHSCAGRRAFHVAWAQALSGRGYVALAVDDFFMQDRDQICSLADAAMRADWRRTRLRHALGAVRYLASRPDVDAGRMAVMGWGDAPLGALLGEPGRPGLFGAAVAVTPPSCEGLGGAPTPVLVLRAGSQAGSGDGACAAPGLEPRVYPGTLPGFDDPQAGRDAPPEDAAAPARRYDRLAYARAIEDVTAFLGRRLGPPPGGGARAYAAAPALGEPGVWAVDPERPGPDLPPAGGSAFDAVFSRVTRDGAVHDVPFPFRRLLAELGRAAGGAAMSRPPLAGTLIPLGRSLQREAAAPDYFESPRIVVAVIGAPDSGRGPLGLRLADRLFLGYQPRAQVLEVISYNEAANRFEFQVVRDYAAGREPRVVYARRALCTSCHQGGGPIFSEAGWEETPADPGIARRLQGLGAEFHGVPVSDAGAVTSIDIAVGAANLLPVYQRLWSEGCAAPQPREAARCRAGALQAMLQYALSDSAGFDRGAGLYAGAYLAVQRRNWAQRWPEGLLIPDPALPNRAPLMTAMPSVVPAAQDPLRHRGPRARWQGSSARDLERLVRGLSHALPGADLARLEAHLRGIGPAAPGRALEAHCAVTRRGFPGRPRLLQIECGERGQAGAGFYLQAQIRTTPEGDAQGEAGWLEIGGGSYARRLLSGRIGEDGGGGRMVLRVQGRDGTAAIRAPDGSAVAGFELRWAGIPATAMRFEAAGRLRLIEAFRGVAATLERLAGEADGSSPLLAERFDGARLSGWLLAALGVRPAPACCAPRPLPEARLEDEALPAEAALAAALEQRGPLRVFRRYCGACHGGDTTHPPGFLHAAGEALPERIAQCAERIYFRLSMWDRAPAEQAVAPMPPPQGLSLAHTTPAAWRESESLQRLTEYVRGLLQGAGRDPAALLAGDYPATRPCLPAGG